MFSFFLVQVEELVLKDQANLYIGPKYYTFH